MGLFPRVPSRDRMSLEDFDMMMAAAINLVEIDHLGHRTVDVSEVVKVVRRHVPPSLHTSAFDIAYEIACQIAQMPPKPPGPIMALGPGTTRRISS